MADHNDPNAVNSIFSDVDVSAADVYDMFGYPSDVAADPEHVVIALTFASVPEAGVFDTDILYRLQMKAHPRAIWPATEDRTLASMLRYFEAVKERYLVALGAAEIRFRVDQDQRARIDFRDFPGGSFSTVAATNTVVTIDTPDGHAIKGYFGGRDDAFFNDLPGFFRSINYAPQFYHIPHTMTDLRELKIPKTLLELEGNHLFNFDPANPMLGRGVKKDLPDGPLTWSGDRFFKDENGNYRFVYSGQDAQAGRNVNAIILEIPLSFITRAPDADRIVDVWGESWVLKASSKVEMIPDEPFWLEHPWALLDPVRLDDELRRYKLVDTVGQPFADAALSEREDNRQLGANNFWLAPQFVKRLAHLGWGFGPSISALGLATSFDHDNSPVSIHRTYALATQAFPRVRKTLFQQLRMRDDSWNKRGLDIPLRRPFEIFVPNVCAIDMDTTGSWPFGRRLEDQVATRFLAMFLDMDAEINGKPYHLETMNDQALWDAAPIEPKTPPNPLRNDKDFLPTFPYLAEPWEQARPMATNKLAGAQMATTDFQRDLDRLDQEIERLAGGGPSASASRHQAIRLVSLQYQRASLLGSWAELGVVRESLGALVARLGPRPDLCLLQAMLALTLHRLGDVRAALQRSPALASSWHGRALEADVLVQEGRYVEARLVYEAVVQEAPTWENLVRLAHVHGVLSDGAKADRLYAEATEEITAKELRAYAWVEVMRGELDAGRGAYDLALAHYERAGAAYSGYWLVDAHTAVALAALGQSDRAIALYQAVIARPPRPELIQALGDAYARAGQLDESQDCYDRAVAEYLDSARRGEVHYLHHLAEKLYADVRRDGRAAVRWAEADFALRPSALTEATLAWAEYQDGRLADALRHIQHALASGVSSAHLLRHSSAIHRACHDHATADVHAQLAARFDPTLAVGHTHP